MDIRQLKYIVGIAESGSITRAAEGLYISQSGLNQQLMRVEQELGAKLFERTTHSLKVTEAGRTFLEYAREAIKRDEQMRRQVSDIEDGSVGEISFNLAMEQGVQLFCTIYPAFHRRYPGITLRLTDYIVYDQYDLLEKGKLDIGMVMISKREMPDIEYVGLIRERFLLGVPPGHPLSANYRCGEDGDFPVISLAACREEPFTLMFSGSTMRQVVDPCFEAAGYKPRILFESRTNHVAALMVSNGICLTIFPESQARLYHDICWFRLPEEPKWESCLIYHRDNPPRKAGRYLIELAQQHASDLEAGTRADFTFFQ